MDFHVKFVFYCLIVFLLIDFVSGKPTRSRSGDINMESMESIDDFLREFNYLKTKRDLIKPPAPDETIVLMILTGITIFVVFILCLLSCMWIRYWNTVTSSKQENAKLDEKKKQNSDSSNEFTAKIGDSRGDGNLAKKPGSLAAKYTTINKPLNVYRELELEVYQNLLLKSAGDDVTRTDIQEEAILPTPKHVTSQEEQVYQNILLRSAGNEVRWTDMQEEAILPTPRPVTSEEQHQPFRTATQIQIEQWCDTSEDENEPSPSQFWTPAPRFKWVPPIVKKMYKRFKNKLTKKQEEQQPVIVMESTSDDNSQELNCDISYSDIERLTRDIDPGEIVSVYVADL